MMTQYQHADSDSDVHASALSDTLGDHRFQFHLEQVNFIEAHDDKSQRLEAAIKLIRELALHRVLELLTEKQEVFVLKKLFAKVQADTFE